MINADAAFFKGLHRLLRAHAHKQVPYQALCIQLATQIRQRHSHTTKFNFKAL